MKYPKREHQSFHYTKVTHEIMQKHLDAHVRDEN